MEIIRNIDSFLVFSFTEHVSSSFPGQCEFRDMKSVLLILVCRDAGDGDTGVTLAK